MESQAVAIVILIVLVGGTVALLARQRTPSWSLPSLRTSGSNTGASRNFRPRDVAPIAAAEALADPGQVSGHIAARPSSGAAFPSWDSDAPAAALDIPRSGAVLELSPALVDRLDQFEKQLEELQRAIDRQHAEIARAGAESRRRFEIEEARREVTLERLRADLVLAIGGSPSNRSGLAERRSEVSAELYARLARFEAALSAVTNPVLLPGEPYTPPEELVTEALIWENWNEIGERAFALADAYSAQRLHLSDETRADIGNFVTALRLVLTRSIYPNLHTDADAAQQEALRVALDEIAAELPKARASLDREYREVRSQ